ncbi:unnamed protein product, partial [Ceratitis capitata]
MQELPAPKMDRSSSGSRKIYKVRAGGDVFSGNLWKLSEHCRVFQDKAKEIED